MRDWSEYPILEQIFDKINQAAYNYACEYVGEAETWGTMDPFEAIEKKARRTNNDVYGRDCAFHSILGDAYILGVPVPLLKNYKDVVSQLQDENPRAIIRYCFGWGK
jgi:hypothetical protein